MAQDRESHRPGSPGMQARQEPGSHGSCATTGHVQCGLAPGASGEQQGEEGAGAHAGGLNLSGADLRMLLMLYTQQQQQQHQHEQQQQFSSQQLQQAMLGAEHLFEVQSQSPFAQTSQQQLQQQQQLLPQLLQRSTPFSAVPAVAPEEKSQPPQLTQPPQLPHPQHAWGAQLPSPLALPYPVLSGDCQAGSPVGLAPEQFSSPMDAEVVAHAPVLEERMSDSAQAAMPRPCPAATQQPLPQPTPLETTQPVVTVHVQGVI
ncbi:hypothetical protein HaLaN_10972 [Haematococcus lacustris]|uniref:Uncharacterized protein n=1 Tax=Haematococcus lacustris TaxID=44745 RepID=A0A699Z6B5_HAELA|nr:hypothetical protein HaLaN_10972 [Haematococcus lacustris]